MLHEIKTEAEYERLKAALGTRLMVLDLSTTWCGPCKRMKPQILLLAQEHPEITFVVINVDKLPDMADTADITSVPTFKFYRNGQWLPGFTGANFKSLQSHVDLYRE